MTTARCISCDNMISIPTDVKLAEIVTCLECGAEHEVINSNPIELIAAPEIEEDWGE
ncbi:lysine biosynthesis protein LysW [Ruegeria atlantica]|uniref:lysine biosynthesis protein LysW n=1 Tax=Ruegeria atlantica TaxID=81569 RepID=UPI001C2C5DB8|nr:lysine biosynthesis protein LysW [Ruegeria atlantica]